MGNLIVDIINWTMGNLIVDIINWTMGIIAVVGICAMLYLDYKNRKR